MNNAYIVIKIFCVLISLTGCGQIIPPSGPEYLVAKSDSDIVIDGRLTEEEWPSTQFSSVFVNHENGQPADQIIQAQIQYDQQALYVAFKVEDKDIFTSFTKSHQRLNQFDDIVEIFIDPDGDGKNYLEIGLSASNLYYSIVVPGASLEELKKYQRVALDEMIHAIYIDGSLNDVSDVDKAWYAEIKLPFSMLEKLPIAFSFPSKGSYWRANLYRIDYDHNSIQNKANGYFSWHNLGSFGYHQPERFSYLRFQ